MSKPEENVETARRCVDALNRRDVEGYLDCCTDDVELRTALVALEGAHEGAAGIRSFFADITDAAPDFWLEVERLEAVGPDRVLGFERGTASGRSSQVTLGGGITFGSVYDFAGGKIRRLEVFTDRQKALEAVGLSE